jgi:hypothetical protein
VEVELGRHFLGGQPRRSQPLLRRTQDEPIRLGHGPR